jgi:hypothetical protein
MAERKLHEGRTPGTILADNSGAARKFGFHSSYGTKISAAPKLSDQWYIEFKGVAGNIMDEFSGLVRSVGPINIQTTTQSIDKYGKRVYIPTRVDFPEVQFTMHDTIDGKTMMLAEGMYRRHFKNSDMNIDGGSLPTELAENESVGRKLAFGDEAFNNFERITLFHWFGDLEEGGKIQRIVLINPVVTSISFSNSDYSTSELRTIDFTFQPESIVFGTPYNESPAIPNWMNQGLEYILDSATVDSSQFVSSRLQSNLGGNKQLGKFGPLGTDNREFEPSSNARGFEQLDNFDDPITGAQRDSINAAAQQQKMNELTKLYSELKAAETAQDDDAKKDVLERLVQARNTIDFVEPRYANRTYTSSEQYAVETMYPNVEQFQTSGGTPVGVGRFNSNNMSNIFAQELTSSFFNGRGFELGNVTSQIAQGIAGNTGIGTIQNLGRTSQSRFGIAGDMVRDGILNSTRRGGAPTGVQSVSSSPVTRTGRDATQNAIGSIKNTIRGLFR